MFPGNTFSIHSGELGEQWKIDAELLGKVALTFTVFVFLTCTSNLYFCSK